MKQTTRRRPPQRVNDPEGTRRDIIDVATTEFAEKGFSGARVDAIAARTRTSKRMIYYYFGSKEGLYIAVLENAYSRIRTIEGSLDLEHQPPDDGAAPLVAFTFDYQNAHPEFVRLVMNENILNGVYLARSKAIRPAEQRRRSAPLRDLLARGQQAGRVPSAHRPGRPAHVDQRAVHLQRRQPRHLLDHLQARHGLAAGAGRAARRGRRHHRPLRRRLSRPNVAALALSGVAALTNVTSSYNLAGKARKRALWRKHMTRIIGVVPPSRADRCWPSAPASPAPAPRASPSSSFSSAFTDQDIRAEAYKALAAAMKDDFDFEPHFNSTLFKQGTELVAMQRGNLEMCNLAPADISKQIPAWSLLTSAYLFRDADHLQEDLQERRRPGDDQGWCATSSASSSSAPVYFGTRQVNLQAQPRRSTRRPTSPA